MRDFFLENVTTLHARVRQLSSSRNNCSKSNMDSTNKNSNETSNKLIVRRDFPSLVATGTRAGRQY